MKKFHQGYKRLVANKINEGINRQFERKVAMTYQVYIELAKNLTLYQHQNINLPVLFMVI